MNGLKDPATIKMLQELGAFILAGANGQDDVKQMVDMICEARGWRWVGVYKVTGGELAIVAGSGDQPPCYQRFPVTQGLCGAAVESRKTTVVDDVREDVRYLPTFNSTLSEMVVPIVSQSDRVVGVLSAESEKLNAFTDEDREVLERVA
ncbi:MAG: GAF domain-containing protein, partial [Chthoniobacterales bacterium]|nr:GAF domain-containing protein [Chthoniobacterales bacterium]